jgi:hypothetical protein
MSVNHLRPSHQAVRLRAIAVLALLTLLVSGSAWAGSEERKGTGGAYELKIPVGPRGTALGGAAVGDVEGIESIFWNPAGLSTLEGTEALFSHTTYFADQKLNFAAIATKVGGSTVIGFNAKVLSIGQIFVTTEDAPEGTGDIITPTFSVLGLSVARQFTDRVRAGVTVNYVNERIIDNSAGGVALDFGVQYLAGWRGVKLGMVMKNFGTSMQFDGPGFEVNTLAPGSDPTSANRTFRSSSSSFEMPSYFSLAATYDLFTAAEYRVTFLGAFQNNNFEGDNLSGALEFNYRNMFALRGSYFGSLISRVDAVTGQDTGEFKSGDDLYQGVALGAGAKLQTGGTKLGVDVAWRPVRNFFDDTVEVGLKLSF